MEAKQMAAQCKQMMAGQSGQGGEGAGMREQCGQMAAMFKHCEQMAAQCAGDSETAEEREQSEPEGPQFA